MKSNYILKRSILLLSLLFFIIIQGYSSEIQNDFNLRNIKLSGSPSALKLDNTIYVFYRGAGNDDNLYYTTLKDKNSRYSKPLIIPNIKLSGSPSAVFYKNRIYVFHYGAKDENTIYSTYYDVDKNSWTNDVEIRKVDETYASRPKTLTTIVHDNEILILGLEGAFNKNYTKIFEFRYDGTDVKTMSPSINGCSSSELPTFLYSNDNGNRCLQHVVSNWESIIIIGPISQKEMEFAHDNSRPPANFITATVSPTCVSFGSSLSNQFLATVNSFGGNILSLYRYRMGNDFETPTIDFNNIQISDRISSVNSDNDNLIFYSKDNQLMVAKLTITTNGSVKETANPTNVSYDPNENSPADNVGIINNPSLITYNGTTFMYFEGMAVSGPLRSKYKNGTSQWRGQYKVFDKYLGSSPSTAIYDNKLYMAFAGNGVNQKYIYLTYTDGDAISWSKNIKIDNLKTIYSPSITSFGDYLFVFHQGFNGQELWYTVHNKYSSKRKWFGDRKLPIKLTYSPCAITYKSKLYVFHNSGGNNHNQLWYTVSSVIPHGDNDQSNWIRDKRIDGLSIAGAPSAVEYNNLLYIFYRSSKNNRDLVYVTFNGTSFSPEHKVNGIALGGTPETNPVVTLVNNQIHIYFRSTSNYYELLETTFQQNGQCTSPVVCINSPKRQLKDQNATQENTNNQVSDINQYQGNTTVYPNPFNNKIAVNFNVPKDSKVNFVIYDLDGKTIFKRDYEEIEKGPQQLTFDLGALKQGVYLYKLNIGDQVTSGKLLK